MTTITGQLPPPNKLYVSTANFISRHLTFSWSPVAPDCSAIHYNILASNCGSCPTTTNHTEITCTNVPTDGSECTFAVQTVACGNITGNTSDPISITFYTTQSTQTGTLHPTDNQGTIAINSNITQTVGVYNSANDSAYLISFSALATVLIAGTVVSISGSHCCLEKEQRKDYSCVYTITVKQNHTRGTNVCFTFN